MHCFYILGFFEDLVCFPARPVHSSLLGLSVTQFSKSSLFDCYELLCYWYNFCLGLVGLAILRGPNIADFFDVVP